MTFGVVKISLPKFGLRYGLVPRSSVGKSGHNLQYKWDVVSVGIHVSDLNEL